LPAGDGQNNASRPQKLIFLLLAAAAMFILSVPLGRYDISWPDFAAALKARLFGLGTGSSTIDTVIFHVRVPRILAALLIGGSLAVSGASYQAILNNPLVSPDVLGASAGAGFGAALAILLSRGLMEIQVFSFVFGLTAVALTCFISSRINNYSRVLIYALTGILVGTVFSSLISLAKYVADPYDKLPAITFWLMGSLSHMKPRDVYVLILPVAVGVVPLYFLRWRINVLSLGDEEAQTLGIDVEKTRLLFILCATLLTSAAVAVSGIIGWVGLVVPHLARAMVGPNYNSLIPASFLAGASYLLLVDNIARVALPVEIPLGILTSIIGAPFFIWILSQARRGWK